MGKDENGLPDDVSADSPNPGERRSNDEGIITESAGGVKQAPPAGGALPDDVYTPAKMQADMEQMAQERPEHASLLTRLAETFGELQTSWDDALRLESAELFDQTCLAFIRMTNVTTKILYALADPEKMRALLDEARSIQQEMGGDAGAQLPGNMPQQTFEEMRFYSYAMADTSTLRGWLAGANNNLLYKRPGERFELEFSPAAIQELWADGAQPYTQEQMQAFLRERGFKGLLTLNEAAACAILNPDEPIALDEFVQMNFDPRSAAERNECRRWTWDTLRAIFSMRLYGVRAGTYRDPDTKQPIDLSYQGEPLITTSPGTVKWAKDQPALWPNADVPVTVGFTMGAWGKKAKKNPKILQHFGEMRAVTAIPGGKPSGAWAQCILFNLNQKWREKAKAVTVTRHTRTDENGNAQTAVSTRWPRAFTRRELLITGCPPDKEFDAQCILDSDHPDRADKYWKAAIRTLKEAGHISHYAELEPLPTGPAGKPKRQGWKDDWLDQPLDIRPNATGKAVARGIRDAHKKHARTRK